MQMALSGYPMERIAVDIMGELPITERGDKYMYQGQGIVWEF